MAFEEVLPFGETEGTGNALNVNGDASSTHGEVASAGGDPCVFGFGF